MIIYIDNRSKRNSRTCKAFAVRVTVIKIKHIKKQNHYNKGALFELFVHCFIHALFSVRVSHRKITNNALPPTSIYRVNNDGLLHNHCLIKSDNFNIGHIEPV